MILSSKGIRSMKNMKISLLVASCAFAGAAFADVDFTYYAAENGSDAADCLSSETAGSISNALARLIANVGNGKSGELIMADGDYDITTAADTGSGYCFNLSQNDNRTYRLRSASGNRENCRLIGGKTGETNRKMFYVKCNNMSVYCDGLTFTNFTSAAGIVGHSANYGALLDFTNCVFRGNGVNTAGGGCFSAQGAARVVTHDCRFERNVAKNGGVMSGGGTNCKFYGTVFADNIATNSDGAAGTGGGGVLHSGSCQFYRCTFLGNKSYGTHENGGTGGVVYSKFNTAYFEDCVFSNNWSKSGTCGMVARGYYNDRTQVRFVHCTFADHANTIGYYTTFDRCLFTGNHGCLAQQSNVSNSLVTANEVTSSSTPFFAQCNAANCTIVSNVHRKVESQAEWFWHDSVFGQGANRVWNCVIVDNLAWYDFGSDQKNTYVTNTVYSGSSHAAVIDTKTCTKVKGIAALKLAMTGEHPFAPTLKSKLLLDKGCDVGLAADGLDYAGNPRIFGKTGAATDIDIGCYEWPGPYPGLLLLVR